MVNRAPWRLLLAVLSSGVTGDPWNPSLCGPRVSVSELTQVLADGNHGTVVRLVAVLTREAKCRIGAADRRPTRSRVAESYRAVLAGNGPRFHRFHPTLRRSAALVKQQEE